MQRIVFTSLFILLSLPLFSQQGKVLFTFGNTKVYDHDFKESCNQVIKKEDNWDFSRLVNDYADYKLEIYDAKQQKIDTTNQYKQRINHYKNKLILAHVLNNKETQKYFKESLSRNQYQYKVSYIKVSISANSKTDTTVAYKKAMTIRHRLLNGYSFTTLARQLSDDENASFNGGNLGWVIPLDFNVGYSAENYIINHYNDKEISMPIKSGDYYYIIKTDGKRKAIETITISTILKYKKFKRSFYNDSIKKLFDEINKKLKNNADFQSLQEKYSEFPHHELTLDLQKAYEKFSTKISGISSVGKYSPIIETDNFFCIVRLDNQTEKTFDNEYNESLTQKFFSSEVFKQCYKAFADSLKEISGYKKISSYHELYKLFPDSAIYHGKWQPEGYLGFYTSELFEFDNVTYTVGDFAQYVYQTQSQCPYNKIENYLKEKYNDFVSSLVDQKMFELLKVNKQYALKLETFSDNVLYDLMEQKNGFYKNALDTQKVYNFYKNSGQEYKTSHILKISFYDYFFDKNSKKAMKNINSAIVSNKEISQNENLKLVKQGVFKYGDYELSDRIISKFDNKEYNIQNNKVINFPSEHIIAITDIQQLPQEETKEKIFTKFSPLYLKSQKENYLQNLRQKYRLEISEQAAVTLGSMF